MECFTVQDAQQQLGKLIDAARHGETVIITDEYDHAVKLVPVQVEEKPLKNRRAGSARGQIWISPDFDEPLEDFKDYM